MNLKKSVISIILVFIVAMVWNGLYHMIFIAEQNALISGLRRPDISEKMFLSLFITITMTILFVVSYSKWLRKGTLYESIIHGLFFSILAGVLVNANQYSLYPIPGFLAFLWFLGGLVEFVLCSVVVWGVFRYGKNE